MSKTDKDSKSKPARGNDKRSQVSQADVPGSSLEQALRIPKAIAEHYAGGNVTPLQLASALNMSPSSGPFRMLCGAAIAYGLTEGGYNAKEILLTPLGRRIVKPLDEGDDLKAKREATLKPRVIGEFLQKYNGSPLPRNDIARNVLEEMKVPSGRTEGVYRLILDSADSVGFIRKIKDKQYVDLAGIQSPNRVTEPTGAPYGDNETDELVGPLEDGEPLVSATVLSSPPVENLPATSTNSPEQNRRVFVTHGKNKALIEPIKKLLGFGEMIPVVSVERESVSKPVPDKVMDDMRTCGAAIIHVADEAKMIDESANEHIIINPNVLIEIGASMALYGRRFILLVKNGIELPSNLQGLFLVRYEGDTLDGNATIRLLEAINDIKNNVPPAREKAAGAG